MQKTKQKKTPVFNFIYRLLGLACATFRLMAAEITEHDGDKGRAELRRRMW